MKQKLVVMEDSGQSGFGGGQRITLEVLNRSQISDDIKLIDTTRTHWHQLINNLNVQVVILPGNNIFGLAFLSFIYSTLKYLIKNEPDKIYITTRKNFIPALIYRILNKKVKIVYHFHLSATKNILWKFYDLLVVTFSKHLIFSSEYTYHNFTKMRNFINKAQGYSISPLPPPKWNWDSLDSKCRLPSQPIVICYIGRISVEKGIFLFLDAVELLDYSDEWRVLIAGDGPARNQLISRINQSKFRDKINYCGPVNTDKNFYKQLSLLIIPSFFINETVCLTAVEAMQAGVPVVCSTNGNLGVFVRKKRATGLYKAEASYIAKTCQKKLDEIKNNEFRRVFPENEVESGEHFGSFYRFLFNRV